MLKTIRLAVALPVAVASLLGATPARAQNADRALLATFCDAASIKGATCKRTKGYPDAGQRGCDVTLSPDRARGKFLASGNLLLVVNYDSGCESHATENGGVALFEEAGGKTVFRGFLPGERINECVTLPKTAQQDDLVCLNGHIGQGVLESSVALINFSEDAGKHIKIADDVLLTAEDATGAYGTNVVTCKERSKVFELSKLAAGPRPATVVVDASYADADLIKTVCAKGFARPVEAVGDPAPGDAFVPDGREKNGKFVIDLTTRKVTPQ